MQKEEPGRIKIRNYQDFLGREAGVVWAQEERIRRFEKSLEYLRKVPVNDENNKLISEYTTRIKDIKDILPDQKNKLAEYSLTYRKMVDEYQKKILPKEFKWIRVDVDGYDATSKDYFGGVPIPSLVFAVSTNTKGIISASYDKQRKIIVNLQNFEIGTIVYQWTSVRNSWYKWATVTSDNMELNF